MSLPDIVKPKASKLPPIGYSIAVTTRTDPELNRSESPKLPATPSDVAGNTTLVEQHVLHASHGVSLDTDAEPNFGSLSMASIATMQANASGTSIRNPAHSAVPSVVDVGSGAGGSGSSGAGPKPARARFHIEQEPNLTGIVREARAKIAGHTEGVVDGSPGHPGWDASQPPSQPLPHISPPNHPEVITSWPPNKPPVTLSVFHSAGMQQVG